MNKKNKSEMSEHMKAIGRKGGLKTAERGSKYMSELGKKGYESLKNKKEK